MTDLAVSSRAAWPVMACLLQSAAGAAAGRLVLQPGIPQTLNPSPFCSFCCSFWRRFFLSLFFERCFPRRCYSSWGALLSSEAIPEPSLEEFQILKLENEGRGNIQSPSHPQRTQR